MHCTMNIYERSIKVKDLLFPNIAQPGTRESPPRILSNGVYFLKEHVRIHIHILGIATYARSRRWNRRRSIIRRPTFAVASDGEMNGANALRTLSTHRSLIGYARMKLFCFLENED